MEKALEAARKEAAEKTAAFDDAQAELEQHEEATDEEQEATDEEQEVTGSDTPSDEPQIPTVDEEMTVNIEATNEVNIYKI